MQSAFVGAKQVIADFRIRAVCANKQVAPRPGSIFENCGDCIIDLGRFNISKPFSELGAIALSAVISLVHLNCPILDVPQH